MAHLGVLLLCSLSIITGPRLVQGQQLGLVKYPVDSLGISDDCASALNTTVDCSDFLGYAANDISTSIGFISEDNLDDICVESCRTSLTSLLETVKNVCSGDVIVYTDNIAYPATYMIDKYIYTYDISCYQSTSDEYCNLVIAGWNETEDHGCDNCNLGLMSVQLEASIAYNDAWASTFASLTSSCGSTAYAYETPAAYTITDYTTSTTSLTSTVLVSATSTSATSTATCTSTYNIQDGDNCTSIALAQNVSTHNIVYANNLEINCGDFPSSGSSICLPNTCATHLLLAGDTCSSLASLYGITQTQLFAWNTNLDDGCRYLDRWRGWYLCVGPPGGFSTTTLTPTAAPVPTTAGTGSNQDCAQWHEVISGDTCYQIASDATISLSDFFFLNPEVDTNCTNLELGVSYCISAVGDISTYSGYPTTTQATVFARPTTTEYTYTLNPSATGTVSNCSQYINYVDISVLSNTFGTTSSNVTLSLNSCSSVAGRYGVTVDNLIAWNPSLSADNCELQTGYSYCVRQTENITVTVTSTVVETDAPSTTTAMPTSATSTTMPASTTSSAAVPSPTQAGASSDCTAWHLVVDGDGCWAISQEYGVSLDDFYTWNPGVGDDCSSLWLGYYVCVGV